MPHTVRIALTPSFADLAATPDPTLDLLTLALAAEFREVDASGTITTLDDLGQELAQAAAVTAETPAAQARACADLLGGVQDEREVNAMLDLVADRFPSAENPANTDRLFLDPACGHGNFLVAILGRKLAPVTPRRYGRGERFEHRILRCLASTYGIDISQDNVREARDRMRAVIAAHLERHPGAESGLADSATPLR